MYIPEGGGASLSAFVPRLPRIELRRGDREISRCEIGSVDQGFGDIVLNRRRTLDGLGGHP